MVLVENNDTLFKIVENLVVSDAHDLRLNKYHADLCHYDVCEEEVDSLPKAARYN